MSNKKTFLAMLIILILITMGGAWASDNVTTDKLSAADSDLMSVDNVDDAQKDTPVIKENLTSQKTEDTVETVDSESNQKGEILSASNDEDVLGEEWENDLTTSSTIVISSSNTIIDGQGHSITMTGNSAIYRVKDNVHDVTFKNITFIGGKGISVSIDNRNYKNLGGAVFIGIGTYKIEFIGCTFRDNSGSSGGAVHIHGSETSYIQNFYFKNCTFINNQAYGTGVNVANNGGGAISAAYVNNIFLDNCTFKDNDGGKNGGVAFFEFCSGDLNITNCHFIHNSANVGGALKYSYALMSLNMNKCIFENNSAQSGNGGDIHIPRGLGITQKIMNSQFINSKAKSSSTSSGLGGSIYCSSTYIEIINSSFKNTSSTNKGAAVYCSGASSTTATTPTTEATILTSVTIKGCNFTGTSTNHAVYINEKCNVNILNSSFINNTAADNPAIYLNGNMTSLSIEGTTFIGNKVTSSNGGALFISSDNSGLTLNKCYFINNTAVSGLGGAVYFEGSSSGRTFDGFEFEGNKATNGGAIYFNQAMSNLNIKNSNFTNNKATTGNGGAIYLPAALTGVTILNSSFEDNTAVSGGAIEFYSTTSSSFSSNINIKRSNFTGNKANSTNVNLGGSAIEFINVEDVDIDDCIFKSNEASNKGTILFNGFDGIGLTGTKFIDNSAATSGGAICYAGSINGDSTLTDCEFNGNNLTAAGNGGAVYLGVGDDVKFNNCNFTNNTIKTESGSDAGQGGAIYSVINNVKITGGRFIDNFASNYGGAVNAIASSWNGTHGYSITGATFINNTAHNGGAVNCYHVRDINITGCTFEKNTATRDSGEGGALALDGFDTKVSGCTFKNNTAGKGSAISYIPGSSGSIGSTQANITDCRFNNNTAITAGTIWFESSKGTINECYFNDNVAPTAAGVYVNIDKVYITNSHFTGNNATDSDAGAILFTAACTDNPVVQSCDFTNNYAKGDGGAIKALAKTTISGSNFTGNHADGNGGAVYLAAQGSSITDSEFTNNNAVKGGAVYVANVGSTEVRNSTFTQNTAENGGAIYYEGNNNGLTIYNDTFTDNTATLNGGAVYYTATTGPLSDYNNFNNHATMDANDRVTGKGSLATVIVISKFDGNIDYFMKANATGQGIIAVIQVTVQKKDIIQNRVVINITAVDENGNTYSQSFTTFDTFDTSSNPDNAIIIIKYDQLPEGKYNCTVGFKQTDNTYLYKEDNVTFSLESPDKGEFSHLQKLINETIANATATSMPAVLNLTDDYTYNEWDFGQINITAPITINGNGHTIRAQGGHSRIFDVLADNVVLNNIIFEAGNATGNESTSHNKVAGGAILWEGDNGIINNCTFQSNNYASEGGAVFVQNNASGIFINNTIFDRNIAENGAAVYINGSDSFTIDGATFSSNTAVTDGTVTIVGSSGTVENSAFTLNQADENYCAGISIIGSNSVTVSGTTFEENTADIYVGQSNGVTLSDVTIRNSQSTSASPIFIDSDVAFDDLNVSGWKSANAIVVNSGKVTVSDSTFAGDNAVVLYGGNTTVADTSFDGKNSINVNNGAEAHLTRVTDSNNDGTYSVMNSGTLYLDGNTFTNVINNVINTGHIKTETTTIVSDNQTIVIENGSSVRLNVSMRDDNNNTIKVDGIQLQSNGNNIAGIRYDAANGQYIVDYNNIPQGVYTIGVNAANLGLDANDYQTATIKSKTHDAAVVLNITKYNQGETVIIRANVTPSGVTGNVTFFLKGIEFGKEMNYTENITVVDGVAELVLHNMLQDTYRVTATYNGDDTHFPADSLGDYLLIVLQRDSNITIKVNDTLQGQDVIAVITTNATFGNVSVTFNQVTTIFKLDANGTAKWNLTAEFGELATGSYTIDGYYVENEYYKNSVAKDTFEVIEYVVKVEVNETEFNQSANITVTINPNEALGGKLNITLDGHQIASIQTVAGQTEYVITTDKLTDIAEHTVNVTYAGNAAQGVTFPQKSEEVKFNVTKVHDYDFAVDVTPAPFGEDTVINVTGPANVDVKISVDGVNYTVTTNASGKAELKLNNITAGTHTVIANFSGNDNYTSKEDSESFTIPQKDPEVQITVTPSGTIAPGNKVNVTVSVGKNATGDAIIYIDNNPYPVEIVNGTASVIIDKNDVKAQPGLHNITVKYYGDENYKASPKVNSNYTVDKYNTTISCKVNVTANNTVIVTVNLNSSAGGLVEINGTNYTVTNGVATINLGVVPQKDSDYTFDVTYWGDSRFNGNQTAINFKVDKLNNLTMDATVAGTQFGDLTNFTVTFDDKVTGNVTIRFNDTSIPPITAEIIDDNKVVIPVASALAVGNYTADVFYTNGTKYNNTNKTGIKFSIVANSSYEFKVEVTPAPFGQNTTIEVTAPAGVHEVQVTVDNVTYTVTVNESGKGVLKLDNITAGHHVVTANFAGNENYTTKEVSKQFDVAQATPAMTIEIVPPSPVTPNTGVNITVAVGKNATGNVLINVSGQIYQAPIGADGNATLKLDKVQPGDYNVTVTYNGDSNYKANEANESFHVDKYDPELQFVRADVAENNNVTFVVQLNNNATGNLTVKIGNTDYNGTVKNGIGTVNVGILTSADPNKYNITYTGDKNFNVSKVEAIVNVGALNNLTMNATVAGTQFGDLTNFTVTFDDKVTGNVTIRFNDTSIAPITAEIIDDNKVVITVASALAVGNYTADVFYTNGTKYNDTNKTGIKFSIVANSSYEFKVEVTPAPFGQNTTIEVTAPAGVHNVNVTVDNVTYSVPINESGKGILKLDNITAGHHVVTANFTGNDNYTTKEVSKQFDVAQATPAMTIEIVPPSPVTPNTGVNITVAVGKNATGNVLINVSGQIYQAPIGADGNATLKLDKVQPGNYNVTVTYNGDQNYKAGEANESFHVDKYDPELQFVRADVAENNNVTFVVQLNNNATGNLTVKIGTKEYNGKVENGVGTVNVGILTKDTNPNKYNVTYNGDKNFNVSEVEASVTIGALNNLTVDATVAGTQFGDLTEFTVTFNDNVTGNVQVVINTTTPTVINLTVQNAKTAVLAVSSALAVGNYTADVYYSEGTVYNNTNKTGIKFSIVANSSYEFKVEVTPAPFGQNTTIEVTAPAGVHEVQVTVDNVTYNVPINESGKGVLKLDNITAGHHVVTANFTGNENYTTKEVSKQFDVAQATPAMAIDIVPASPVAPNTGVNITIAVGKNATGNVLVNVSGQIYQVPIGADGNATVKLDKVQPGDYNVTVTYNGDSNYKANEANESFHVDKYDPELQFVRADVDDNNNVTFVVQLNQNATGNLTVKIGSAEYNGKVENGIGTVNVGILTKENNPNKYNVTYNGDKNFNVSEVEASVTIGALNNLTVDATVAGTQFGDLTEFTVTFNDNVTGNVQVVINTTTPTVINLTVQNAKTAVLHVTSALAVGNYTADVYYSEGTVYNNTNKTGIKFSIVANSSYEFKVEVTSAPFGENTTIEVTAPAGVHEVQVTVDNVTYNVPINESGKGVLKLDNITAGHHVVTANFTGNENYTTKEVSKQFDVAQATPVMAIDIVPASPVAPNTGVNITIAVGKNATGNVLVNVSGQIYQVPIGADGNATVKLDKVQPGDYNVTVTYNGDSNYKANEANESFHVDKYDPELQFVRADIADNNNVTFVVKLNENATGNLTVKIGNDEYKGTVENGVGTVNVGILTKDTNPNKYNITYSGDKNFNESMVEASANIDVLNNLTVDATVAGTQFGDLTEFTVTFDDVVTGNVTIKFNDTSIPDIVVPVSQANSAIAAVASALPVGNYTVDVFYTNGDVYGDANKTGIKFSIVANSSYEFKVEITPAPFGDNTTIEVTAPAGVHEVEVTVDNVTYTVPVNESGKGILKLDNITAGHHVVTANVTGNENYTTKEVSKQFDVAQATPAMNIDIVPASPVAPNTGVNITVAVGKNATGNVIVNVNGQIYQAPIGADGNATLELDKVQPGEYNVTVTYNGDSNYKASGEANESFKVDKYDPQLEFVRADIDSNNNVTFVIKLNENATGKISVKVGDTVYNGTVENGIGTVNVGILTSDNNPNRYNVTYKGDSNFNESTVEVNATIGRLDNLTMNVAVEDTQFGDNTKITVTFDDEVTGDVTVLVNGTPVTAVKQDGKTYVATVDPALAVGNYTVNVTLTNDNNYMDRKESVPVSIVANSSYVFDVSVDTAPFGENTTITVTAPAGVHEVEVTVDNVTYTVPVNESGKGVLKLDNITAGHHKVTANFTGNENYTAKTATDEFDITANSPEMTVIVPSVVNPATDVDVTVIVGKNATGFVVMNISGSNQMVPIEDGKAVYTIRNVQPGNITVTATYGGDKNYNPGSSALYTTLVEKFNTTMDYKPVIPDNNNVTIRVFVNSSATGTVTIEHEGVNYTANVSNGVAEVNMNVLFKENNPYNLTAVYSGDSNFNPNQIEVDFIVNKFNNCTLDVEISETQFGDNTTITVKLPSDAGNLGNVTVWVNETEYTAVRQADGTYVAVTKVLPVGDYVVNVTYAGGSIYNDTSSNGHNFSVKANSSYEFKVDITPAPFGENTTITVTAPAGVHEVEVTVDDVTYTVPINESGKGSMTLDNLTAGNHKVTANFTGNENYTTKEIKTDFDVDQATPAVQIIVPADAVEPNTNVNVTVIVGKNATGIAVVTVDGVQTTIDVKDGVGILPLDKVQPGNHTITAQYTGDRNYTASAVETAQFEVAKYNTTVTANATVNEDNSVVVDVYVNSTAGGDVKIEYNGQNYTAPVENGVAHVNIPSLPQGDYDFTAVYSGNENFNTNSTPVHVEVRELRNYTIGINVTPGKHGENTTITVVLPPGADGDVTITVGNETYPAVINPDGTATINVTAPVGINEVNVTYANSTVYAPKNATTTFTVEPQDEYPLEIAVTPAPYGQNTTIAITAPADVAQVNVTVDEVTYLVNLTDGKGELKLDDLTATKHDVTVSFAGDENYTANSNSTKFNVPKQNPDIKVTIPDVSAPATNIPVTVEVADNATGFVSIVVDGKDNMVPVVNGVAQFNITGAQPGNHTVEVRYTGDDNYGGVNVTAKQITVERFNTTMSVDTEVPSDNNVTVVVTLNSTASGEVTIEINGENKTGIVENGVARVNLGILPPNTSYDLTAVYSGDSNFNGNATPVKFDVGKLSNYTIGVNVTPGKHGENTTITVILPPDADGNLTVTVGNETYPVTINPDGTGTVEVPSVVGPNEVKVTYENSTRYDPQNATATYTVDPQDEYPLEMEITPGNYGEDTVIAITAPGDVTQVNVTVDGVPYVVDLTDGKGNLTLNNLSAGKHVVETTFAGNENYTKNSNKTTFDVPQTTPTIKVDVAENNTAGTNVVVNVEIDKNATGSVNVIVDGQDHVVPIVDGKAQYTIEGAQPGQHNITVTYPGDINYTAAVPAEAQFSVDTFPTSMEILPPEIDDDNNVTVVVKVNKTATGNVTVKVGDKTYNATVDPETGIAKVNVGVLPAGDSEINVTYSGDDKFNGTSTTQTVTVPSLVNYDLPVTSNDIKYGEVAQVNVTLPDGASADNLKFYVDGAESTNYTVNGNVVTLNAAGLGAGDHTVEVKYSDDGTYANRTNSTTFNVAKVEPGIKEINVTESIDVGEVANVTVKLPEDANGRITVDVNGTKYTADVVNGTANISIPNLGDGTYVLNITYSGDDNYDPINVVKEVTASKVVPEIAANTSDITLGDNTVVEVTLPDDATGNVTIKVGGVEQTAAVHGGVNSIIVPGIPVGENQEVTVTYNGNDKYTANTTTASITVSPKPTNPDDIKVIDNGDGTVTVIVPDNATGNVTVKIGDEVLPAVNLTNGKAVINLTNSSAKPGKHNITVAYSGDENHTAVEVNAIGEIPKWDSAVNATALKIREGDVATIEVEVAPADATGKVYVEVNGTTYAADLENGKATINAPGLKQGTYDIKVTYAGDKTYLNSTNATSIVVEAPITVEVNGTGADSQIVINLPDNSTENVTAYIDGTEVPVVFDESGNPTVNLSGVKPGQHNVTIVYVDQNNSTSVVNTQVNVPKWPSTVNATAPTIREGDVLPVTVKVGSADMTGLVLVDVNGTGYYANLTNGEAIIYAPGLKEGVYSANVTYLGDEVYEIANNTFTFAVEAPLVITVEGAGNSTKVIVDLPANGTANVTMLVDGKEVPVTVSDGKAVAELNNVTAGDHNVTVIYTDKYGTQSVVNQTIKVYNSIKANNMKRGWNSPYDYEAEFLDKDGHVIANTVMQFKVNGKTYKVKTDSKGIAKLTASKLDVGKYTVEITNTVTGEKMSKTVTIVERLIKNKDITMDFADGTYYTVTAIGDDGNPVGKNEVVGIKVNTRDYVVLTNSKGVAKLQINLIPKKYTITAEYAKYKVSNKLVVKQTLKLVKKTVTVKKSAKKLVLKATLKWTNGKAIKGKQIVFKFYGKTYKVKTNSKGLAKVTIKKSIIKKLKKGKKYAYSAAYKTNIVKGKVKVKK